MKYHVAHTTTYRYAEAVSLAHNQAHLTPRSGARQQCLRNAVLIQPTPAAQQTWLDYFGNPTLFFSLEEPHRDVTITAHSEVLVEETQYPEPERTPAWERVRDQVAQTVEPGDLQAALFVHESPLVRMLDEARAYAAASFLPGRPLLAATSELTARIFRDFRYDNTATCVHTPTQVVFQQRRGVCQDFAHLQIACLRSLGLPARYVSGYLLTAPPPGQPKLIGADASHAWLSVFCPGWGWIDFDPTNNQMPRARHITLAWGRDYSDVCPVKGVVIGGGEHSMHVAVDVTEA